MQKLVLGLALLTTVGCSNKSYRKIFKDQQKPNIGQIESLNTYDVNTGNNYATSGWPAAHRDCRNSDYYPLISPDNVKFSWMGFEGAGFFIGPTVGPDGTVYGPTGLGKGHSHLGAYDRFGNLLWETKPMETEDDLDYGAELNAPTIDVDGNIYQADWNQLWSFNSKGEKRWVANLREYGIQGCFISPFFTKDGNIGGVSTDGYLIVFDTKTGKKLIDPMKLPGANGPKSIPMPKGVWGETQIGPEFSQFSWDATFGLNMQVANTPSVDPNTGRIFVVANGTENREGVIHGIDLTSNGPQIAFTTSTGAGGSGTSPTISFDGTMVYLTDGEGFLNGIDSKTGKIIWRIDTKSVTGVSSTVTPDGMVLNYSFNYLTAYDGKTGRELWKKNVDYIAKDELHGLPAKYGEPSATVASALMATPDRFWAIIIVNSKIAIPEKKQQERANKAIPMKGIPIDSYRQPIKYYLCSFDYNGNLLSKAPAPDNGAIISAGLDGRIFVTGLSVVGGIAYYKANPKMPFFMRNTPKPIGGMWGYEPESFISFSKKASGFVIEKCENALKENDKAIAKQNINLAKAQIVGIKTAIEEASWKKEISENQSKEWIEILESSLAHLNKNQTQEAIDQVKYIKDKM